MAAAAAAEEKRDEARQVEVVPEKEESRGPPMGTRFVSTVVAVLLAATFIGVPVLSGFASTSFLPLFVGASVLYLVTCIYFLRDILSYR